MSEEELCKEIKSGAFSMQVADCERNIKIQFEKLQQENYKLKKVIEKAIDYIDCHFKEMVADEEAQELKSILKEVNK